MRFHIKLESIESFLRKRTPPEPRASSRVPLSSRREKRPVSGAELRTRGSGSASGRQSNSRSALAPNRNSVNTLHTPPNPAPCTKTPLLPTPPPRLLLLTLIHPRSTIQTLSTMDHETLRTASTYLNNLLLARGLLRPPADTGIDFVKPTRDARAYTINLIHDLLLRDDRARDQRDATAHLIRQLRAESTRQTAEISRLTTQAETEARGAAQARAAQEKAEAEVKRLEGRVKVLREDVGKLKTSLTQTKAGCATEVRKRDLELGRLRGHLQGQQRGGKQPGGGGVGVVGPSLTISGVTAEKRQRHEEQQQRDVQDPEYTLRQETTSFLTHLAQTLSEENDSLLAQLRHALHTLHDLLNLPAPPPANPHPDSLAADLTDALSTLTNLLRDPNFVPLEDVLERDDEIARLRAGWERMEARWRDILSLMEGWRRRMEDGGHTVDLEDLRRGIGMVSPARGGREGEEEEEEVEDLSLAEETSERSMDGGVRRSSEGDVVSQHRQHQHQHHHHPRTAALTTSPRKKGQKQKPHNVLSPPSFFDLRPLSNSNPTSSPLPAPPDSAPPSSDSDSDSSDASPLTVAEKLYQVELAAAAATTRKPAPLADRPNPPPSSKPASRSDRPTSPSTQNKRSARLSFGLDGAADNNDKDDGDDDTLGHLVSASAKVAKRTKIRGRPKKRRKSTLTAEELERLMFAGAEDGE